MNAMLLLAVSTFDKLKNVPPSLWWKVVLGILAFFVAVFVLKRLFKVNKVLLTIVVLFTFALTFISWVYNRNEPAFLTPFIDQLAPFLPTKGAYEESEHKPMPQADQPKKPLPPPPSQVY